MKIKTLAKLSLIFSTIISGVSAYFYFKLNVNAQLADALSIPSTYRPTSYGEGLYEYSGSKGLSALKLDFEEKINGLNSGRRKINPVLFPMTIDDIAQEKVRQFNNDSVYDVWEIENSGYWTGAAFCTNYKNDVAYPLDFVFNYDPEIADMKVTISSVQSDSIRIYGALGVFFEESYAVSSSLNVTFTTSETKFTSVGSSLTIDMAGKEKGKYQLQIQFKNCTKYFLKYNNRTGKLERGLKFTKYCPNDAYTIEAVKI